MEPYLQKQESVRVCALPVESALLMAVLCLQMGAPFGGLGGPNMEQMAAMGMQGHNMNPQVKD